MMSGMDAAINTPLPKTVFTTQMASQGQNFSPVQPRSDKHAQLCHLLPHVLE